MTREEAIAYFKKNAIRIKGIMAEEGETLKDRFSQSLEATEMAIKALEQEPTTKNDLEVDCISRQAVIDMTGLSEWFDSSDSYNAFVFALSELPSVTPQEPFKPMVEIDLYSVIKQSYIEREVLDKIRAEIVGKHLSIAEKNDFDNGRTYGYEEVLEIIDKYKAESE